MHYYNNFSTTENIPSHKKPVQRRHAINKPKLLLFNLVCLNCDVHHRMPLFPKYRPFVWQLTWWALSFPCKDDSYYFLIASFCTFEWLSMQFTHWQQHAFAFIRASSAYRIIHFCLQSWRLQIVVCINTSSYRFWMRCGESISITILCLPAPFQEANQLLWKRHQLLGLLLSFKSQVK